MSAQSDKFWELIEASWQDTPEADADRKKAIKSNDKVSLLDLSDEIEESILTNYEDRLYELTKPELTAFIHTLEEKLFELDRKDLQKKTKGGKDGFLYVRCFVVAMGQEYFENVKNDPAKIPADIEAEGFGFTAYSVYADRFDEDFRRNTKHNTATGSNVSGWS